MERFKIKQHWENVYSSKQPQEMSWFQAVPFISLTLIKSISDNQARVIDVGAGTSTLVDTLIADGYANLAVLDISGAALDLMKRRLEEKANTVEWHINDIRNFLPPHQYDVWHDRAVFHFLIDDESRRSYVATLKNTIKKGGHSVIATFAKNGPTKCSGLNIVQYDAASIELVLGDEFKLLKSELETHRTPRGHEQLFHYFLFERL